MSTKYEEPEEIEPETEAEAATDTEPETEEEHPDFLPITHSNVFWHRVSKAAWKGLKKIGYADFYRASPKDRVKTLEKVLAKIPEKDMPAFFDAFVNSNSLDHFSKYEKPETVTNLYKTLCDHIHTEEYKDFYQKTLLFSQSFINLLWRKEKPLFSPLNLSLFAGDDLADTIKDLADEIIKQIPKKEEQYRCLCNVKALLPEEHRKEFVDHIFEKTGNYITPDLYTVFTKAAHPRRGRPPAVHPFVYIGRPETEPVEIPFGEKYVYLKTWKTGWEPYQVAATYYTNEPDEHFNAHSSLGRLSNSFERASKEGPTEEIREAARRAHLYCMDLYKSLPDRYMFPE